MSRLQTIFTDLSVVQCIHAARCVYAQQTFPRGHMEYVEYEQRLLDECVGAPAAIVIDQAGRELAWMVYDINTDSHFPGLGSVVYYLLVDKNHPEALRTLMHDYRLFIRSQGCEWYQTTKRLSETEFKSTYKRIQ